MELATVKEKYSFQLENAKDIHVLAVSPKGDKIMTTGFHGNTIVYSFPECKEIKRMSGYGNVQFSPDGKSALTFTKNGRMMLWDLDK
ncbi:MAG: WD40 repeat domain-containing protein [Gemmataceae bacterium]|nr:WD40 repeat domain-containing protein [Gemmataceae bacterium]